MAVDREKNFLLHGQTRGLFLEDPAKLLHPERDSNILNLITTGLFYLLILI